MGKQGKKTTGKTVGKGRVKDLRVKNASKVKGGGASLGTGWDLKQNKKV